MKKNNKTISYTVLRNHIGNYLAYYEKGVGCDLEWYVSSTPWNAKNFFGNPNELYTARKHFPKWKVVNGVLTWKEVS